MTKRSLLVGVAAGAAAGLAMAAEASSKTARLAF
jgi:hypothetical protein